MMRGREGRRRGGAMGAGLVDGWGWALLLLPGRLGALLLAPLALALLLPLLLFGRPPLALGPAPLVE